LTSYGQVSIARVHWPHGGWVQDVVGNRMQLFPIGQSVGVLQLSESAKVNESAHTWERSPVPLKPTPQKLQPGQAPLGQMDWQAPFWQDFAWSPQSASFWHAPQEPTETAHVPHLALVQEAVSVPMQSGSAAGHSASEAQV
jgi:hypothetical protein